MKITLAGNPVTKKNSQQIILAGGHPRIIPSKPFREYEAACLAQLARITDRPTAFPVNLRCVYWMKTLRYVDLVNLIEATQDILVRAGVLPDDNSRIIRSVDGCRVEHDKDNPRVEIWIEEAIDQCGCADATIQENQENTR